MAHFFSGPSSSFHGRTLSPQSGGGIACIIFLSSSFFLQIPEHAWGYRRPGELLVGVSQFSSMDDCFLAGHSGGCIPLPYHPRSATAAIRPSQGRPLKPNGTFFGIDFLRWFLFYFNRSTAGYCYQIHSPNLTTTISELPQSIPDIASPNKQFVRESPAEVRTRPRRSRTDCSFTASASSRPPSRRWTACYRPGSGERPGTDGSAFAVPRQLASEIF